MSNFEIMRATEEWQRAGAYSVRIQGMNRQHNISLRDEFDEHDTDGTKYIVILDSKYPIATCRFYETDSKTVKIGRVVVLEEYRGQNLGRLIITEAEKWIKELGYRIIEVDSRKEVTEFYKKLGFRIVDDNIIQTNVFECIKMVKEI